MARAQSNREWMVEFGRKLAFLRKKRRLTQSQLSSLLDVQPSVISRWEIGAAKPHFDFIVKLASALEVTFDELLGEGEDSRRATTFDIQNRRLKELAREVDRLGSQDQDAICHLMDSLIRKDRVKAALRE